MSEREGYRERGEVKKVSVLLMHACVSFQNLALMVIVISSGSWGQLGQETRYIHVHVKSIASTERSSQHRVQM